MTKVIELYGHTQRVLHMSLAPDNSTICTASADETLRFWKVFESGSSPYS
jgi:cell division cycle protein 20 (cofactor of APC complex)